FDISAGNGVFAYGNDGVSTFNVTGGTYVSLIGGATSEFNLHGGSTVVAWGNTGADYFKVTNGTKVFAVGFNGENSFQLDGGSRIYAFGGSSDDHVHMDGTASAVFVDAADGNNSFNVDAAGVGVTLIGGRLSDSFVIH